MTALGESNLPLATSENSLPEVSESSELTLYALGDFSYSFVGLKGE